MPDFDFTLWDGAALATFLLAWLSYGRFADYSRWSKHSVSAAMHVHRRRWFRQMLRREVRIVDTQILGNLLTAIGFFASTTILLVGGFAALFGAGTPAIEALSHLPLAVAPDRPEWNVKVGLMATIFIYAFFKFAWSFRLTNYCSILVGAAPIAPVAAAEAEAYAELLSTVHARAAHHFNRGLRAYLFGLAALGWFVHPAVLVAATAGVVAVLYRREFQSHMLRAVRPPPP